MNSFKVLLKKFDSVVKKHNPVNYEKLQKPLYENTISDYLKGLDINDETFRLLFKWKNGFDFTHGDDPRNQIFDFGALLSLERILKLEKLGLDIWKKTFVPIISSGDGDYILFNNKRGENYGKLHLYSAALLFIENPISYYDSIYTMIETTIEAYEKKILVYDPKNNWLNDNVKDFHTLAKRINKRSDYWKLD